MKNKKKMVLKMALEAAEFEELSPVSRMAEIAWALRREGYDLKALTMEGHPAGEGLTVPIGAVGGNILPVIAKRP